jgi:hypothetical protein
MKLGPMSPINFENIIWMGDFNYRINGETETIMDQIHKDLH